MNDRILVPMDDSEMAEQALEHALETYPDADVTVLHVVGGPSMMMGSAVGLALEENIEEAAADEATPVLDRAREVATARDREIDTAVGLGDAAREIVERAADYDAVVMGSHGRHSSDLPYRFLVGDVAKKVFRRSPVPVTSVR